MAESAEKKPRGKRLKRFGIWSASSILLLSALAGVLLLSVIGTRLSAPDWLRTRLNDQINASVESVSVHFGDVAMVLEDGLVPRLWLRDVMVRDDTGLPIASLSDVQATVALQPLLRGEIQPSDIQLSGARLKLRREDDGAIGLSVGPADAPVEQASNVAGLVERLDRLLQRPAFATLARVDVENVSLQYEDLRSGRAWSVDGGRIGLTRTGDDLRVRGDFALIGARDYATTLEMNYAGQIGETAAEVGVSFQDMPSRDIAGQSPALAWLGALDAPISGALRASVDDDGALGPLNATLQIGAGVVQPTEATAPIAFDAVRSYFTYDPGQQKISFSDLSIDSKWVKTSADGHAYLMGVENGWPSEILVQIGLDETQTNPVELYPEPITLEAAQLDMRLQLDPFVLTLGELSLSDQGQILSLNGEARAEERGWNVSLGGHLPAAASDRILELWPEALASNARKWIVNNVKAAEISNVQLAVRSLPKRSPDVFLGFDFAGFSTQFIKKVPLIEAARGHATLQDNRFVVSALGGHVTAAQGGRIDISGTSFEIPDVSEKRTPAVALLRTESTITAALSLLDEEPFRFLQKAGRPVTLADGRAKLAGRLDFRMVDKLLVKDVDFNISGMLSDVRSEVLVPDRILSATKLVVNARDDTLVVAGEGRVGQVPFDAVFETDIGPDGNTSNVRGTVELSERFADEFKIGLPPGSVSGAGQGDLEIDFERGAPGIFRLSSNLAGVGLRLPQLDWALPRAGTGDLQVSGRLGEPPSIDRLSISGAGLRARGTVSLRPNGQLDRASFTRVQVGSWIDAPVELVGRGGATPAVRVLGGTIDLRQTSLAGRGDGGSTRTRDGGPVSLVLDQLQISEGIALSNFRAELDMSRGADGTFTGRVNGYAPISGRVIPQGGRSAFRIQSNDAGGVFGSAGLLKQARNGKLDLTLVPGKARGTYEGQLKATGGMRLKEAPAMASLLNAISVVGILEQMGGEGIHFQEIDARFQLSPDRVTLYSGSATGASMGISMDGYYYMRDGRMDMQGVISPIYLVNAVGGIFTRRGEGLFGFNYTLKGPASNPSVSVNPLSAFTPGMFRELFRRAPPKRPSPTQPAATTPDTGAQGQTGTAGTPAQPQGSVTRNPVLQDRSDGR